jgi:hypothetical protein
VLFLFITSEFCTSQSSYNKNDNLDSLVKKVSDKKNKNFLFKDGNAKEQSFKRHKLTSLLQKRLSNKDFTSILSKFVNSYYKYMLENKKLDKSSGKDKSFFIELNYKRSSKSKSDVRGHVSFVHKDRRFCPIKQKKKFFLGRGPLEESSVVIINDGDKKIEIKEETNKNNCKQIDIARLRDLPD